MNFTGKAINFGGKTSENDWENPIVKVYNRPNRESWHIGNTVYLLM